jgi:hypothetical protein
VWLSGVAVEAEALLFALKYFFGHAGALAALAGNAKGGAQVVQAAGALGYGIANLRIVDVVAKTDVHGLPLTQKIMGRTLIAMRIIVNKIKKWVRLRLRLGGLDSLHSLCGSHYWQT